MKKLLLLFIGLVLVTGVLYAGWLDDLFNRRKGNKKYKRGHVQVGAVRGVDEEGNINYDLRDYSALEKMESLKTTKKEIDDFVKEGGLK